MFVIPTADALVNYIKDFTGSTNDAEIKQCIFLAELSMRNIELPALRSDPYDPQYIGVVDDNGSIPIPGDMNKPILFFKQGAQYVTSATAYGTSGQSSITLTTQPAQSLTAGMLVTGTGIGTGATVTSTNSQITGTCSGTAGLSTITVSSLNGQVVPNMTVNIAQNIASGTASGTDGASTITVTGVSGTIVAGMEAQANQLITATGVGLSGASTITISGASGTILAGMYVTGDGIGTNAKVVSVVGSTVTLDVVNTTAVNNTVSFLGQVATNALVVSVVGSTVTLDSANIGSFSNSAIVFVAGGVAPGVTVVSVVGSTITLNTTNTGTFSGYSVTFTAVSPQQVISLSVANSGAVNGTVVFQTPAPASAQSQTGPWIVYDRIGDRDIITQSMIAQLYLQPVNVPAVIRGKFSEVGQKYKFLPYVAEGDLINMYYYKAWPLLFSPIADILISTVGTVGTISGAGTVNNPYLAHITGMTTTAGMEVGQNVTATAGTGSIGGSEVTVYQVVSETEIIISVVGATTPTAGTVTDIKITGLDTQTNPVLQTWPEGYVYSTLREYYLKRHNETDAATYEGKFQQAWATVEDQNNLGKWSGGHTRLTSVWQPRQYRQYNIK
jgi:hypothetical protein